MSLEDVYHLREAIFRARISPMQSSERDSSKARRKGAVLLAVLSPIGLGLAFHSTVIKCACRPLTEEDIAAHRASRARSALEHGRARHAEGHASELGFPNIQNGYYLTPKIFSGAGLSDPKSGRSSEETLADLALLGVTSIVSVDGSRPEVDEARRQGMRYVHLPVGYDTISPERIREFAAVVDRSDGPVYFHCHHGRHRGPVAAALAARATDGWNADRVRSWLSRAGTAFRYTGLIEAALEARVPKRTEWQTVPTDLPEVASVPPLAEAMAKLEDHMENLEALSQNDFRPIASHPDIEAAQEALQVEELLREIPRSGSRSLDTSKSVKFATKLRKLLSTQDLTKSAREAKSALSSLRIECSSCHKRERGAKRAKYRQ